jgi:Holliday junction resolvase
MIYKIDSKLKDIGHYDGKSSFKNLGWTEKDLENLVVRNIDTLIGQDLMVVFQETRGQEEPDILAIDSEGTVWFFELKRWSADIDAVQQIIRYAQKFGRSPYRELNEYYNRWQQSANKTTKIFSLEEEHKKYFGLDSSLPKMSFNKNHVLVVLSDGIVQDCIEAIRFWDSKGIDIRYCPVHMFKSGNEELIEFPQGQSLGEGTWMLNTNRGNSPADELKMLSEKIAAAYCDPAKYKIEKLKHGDQVFLYSNSQGIIATGVVDGKLQKRSYGGNSDDEYFVSLKDFKRAPKPLSAEMLQNTILGRNLNFRLTLVSLEPGDREVLLKYF